MEWRRPLVLGGLSLAAIAGLSTLRTDDEGTAGRGGGNAPVAEPLVALPWDKVVEQRFGEVVVEVPTGWSDGALDTGSVGGSAAGAKAGPVLMRLVVRAPPQAALTDRLATDCARPVVLRWRDQWRAECRTRDGRRVRGAVIRLEGESRADGRGSWHGVEARYPDRRDPTLAPRVGRMLASMRAADPSD